jgi:hypothetical protein
MWIKVDSGIVRHKKTVRLAKILKVPPYAAVGMLVAFWADAMTNSIDGDITDRSPEEIDEVVGWKGRSSFLSALIEVGFVDLAARQNLNQLTIHDWNGNSGAYFLQTAAGRERVAKHRAKKKHNESQNVANNVTVTEALRNDYVTVTEALRNSSCNGDVTLQKRIEEKRKEEYIPPTPFCDELAPAAPEPVSVPEGVVENEAKETTGASKTTRKLPKVPDDGKIQPEAILTLWNENRHPKLSAVKAISDKRRKLLKKRLEQFPELEEWRTAIRNLSASSFHTGGGPSGWLASFDWLLSEGGLKAFEGPLENWKPSKARVPVTSTYNADPIPLSVLPPVEPFDLQAARNLAVEIETEKPKRRRM